MNRMSTFSLALLFASSVISLHCGVRELTTLAEYNGINRSRTRVVIFNRDDCQFCHVTDKALGPVSSEYYDVDFYKLNLSNPEFAQLRKELKEQGKVTGFPTAFFLKAGSAATPSKDDKFAIQKGGMDERDLGNQVKNLLQQSGALSTSAQSRRAKRTVMAKEQPAVRRVASARPMTTKR